MLKTDAQVRCAKSVQIEYFALWFNDKVLNVNVKNPSRFLPQFIGSIQCLISQATKINNQEIGTYVLRAIINGGLRAATNSHAIHMIMQKWKMLKLHQHILHLKTQTNFHSTICVNDTGTRSDIQ